MTEDMGIASFGTTGEPKAEVGEGPLNAGNVHCEGTGDLARFCAFLPGGSSHALGEREQYALAVVYAGSVAACSNLLCEIDKGPTEPKLAGAYAEAARSRAAIWTPLSAEYACLTMQSGWALRADIGMPT